MEERHPDLIVAKKDYTPFPISAIGLFKPRDLYLLAGMYLSSSYQRDGNFLHTDITIPQLSSLCRKRSIPTHSERLNPPTIIAKMALKSA